MNSVVLFCILVALATTLVASVRAIDVSVLGVPGTFHAPSGVSCGGSDLTRIGACPGPQPRVWVVLPSATQPPSSRAWVRPATGDHERVRSHDPSTDHH
ncbi:hypothetical protein DYB25_008554 [Aphanomyces astaci]|uniref:Secreted protein n=1 Tax=Aphanomyces astaci TaxID=112090 RepID=A0A397BUW3_APHAT|nr:hypothetical protein DYB25_008554 [Aphanomyces astaci]